MKHYDTITKSPKQKRPHSGLSNTDLIDVELEGENLSRLSQYRESQLSS